MVCKLCLGGNCEPAGSNKRRAFIYCPSCGLVFVPERDWPSTADEIARYAHHDNHENNPGYVRFLAEVGDVVAGIARPRARVLDFGAGENAVLTGLLARRGYDCVAYDPLYHLGDSALAEQYDVIVLCEVIEHLRKLRDEVVRLGKCLSPGGRIVVRTQCYPSVAGIPSWWYARDATHINFFAPQTLAFAAGLCGLTAEATANADLVIWTSQRL